jgi:hypothetical protein
MRSILAGLAALALVGPVSANAAATLIGTNVTLNYLYPNSGTVIASSVVNVTTNPTLLSCSPGGAGVCAPFAEDATFRIGANTLTLMEDAGSSYTPAAFNGIEFDNLSFGSGLTGFNLFTNLPGLTVANITETPTSIAFNAQGLSFANRDYFITLTLFSTAPEASTWIMMILGFAGLGLASYRASRKSRLSEV